MIRASDTYLSTCTSIIDQNISLPHAKINESDRWQSPRRISKFAVPYLSRTMSQCKNWLKISSCLSLDERDKWNY